jgi:hypothetical protein
VDACGLGGQTRWVRGCAVVFVVDYGDTGKEAARSIWEGRRHKRNRRRIGTLGSLGKAGMTLAHERTRIGEAEWQR